VKSFRNAGNASFPEDIVVVTEKGCSTIFTNES
jgi:hypothetical protein